MANAPIAIDGGWGWVVVLAAFVAYFIADGWSYSFGIFYRDLLDYFHEGKGKTALIGALLYGFPLLISPVICALVTSYGCRKIGIIGGFIFGISFVFSAFAGSVDVLCISVGVISSIGLSMAYISSLVIVTYYFEKRRGLATGLAVTGSGLGAFAFPPLLERLIDIYAWPGTLLILGGVGFQIMVSGALYRAPPMMSNDNVQDDFETGETELHGDEEDEELEVIPSGKSARTERPLSMVLRSEDVHYLPHQSHSLDDNRMTSHRKIDARECVHLPLSSDEDHEVHRLLEEVERGMQPSSKRTSVSSPELYEPVNQQRTDMPLAKQPNNQIKLGKVQVFWRELSSLMTNMMDKSLLVNLPYLLFCASNFILYLWVGVPYVYLVDKATILKIDKSDSAFLLSIIGITRTVGQLVLGYLGDSKALSTTGLYAICITFLGLITLLVPVFTIYPTLCFFSAVFGFFVSVTYALQMIVVVEIVGITKATNAFGLVQLSQGISTLLGTPVAGIYSVFSQTVSYKI